MDLEAISGAATVALTSTIVFLLIAKTWNAVSRTINSAPSFSDRIMHESAQRFRDEFERLSQSQAVYLSGTLVFLVLFVAAYLLQAQSLFKGYPSWQLYGQLAFLTLVAAFAIYHLVKTVLAQRQVRFLRDANVAVGHQLQTLSASGIRVFHDVATTAGIVDHVILGQKGIYAINVVARRSRKRTFARLRENSIEFANGKQDFSIVDLAAKTARLQKEFRALLGHKVRVRSVIAVPGWEIGEQTNDKHLLVNERTIAMLSGWNDNSDYLMNEDVELIQQDLISRCGQN
tara:strand:+ start:8923 stop:9786 length:864 start_codon:yes stop_codon:yes gene_type:complete